MSDPLTMPTSVYESRLRDSDWQEQQYGSPKYRAFFVLDGDTISDSERATVLLNGFAHTAAYGRPWHKYEYRINRMELIWEPHRSPQERRGAILFSEKNALLHCVHALAGYGGSGAAYGALLFDLIGAQDIFPEIDSSIAHRPYHIVVSRERTDTVHGIEAALPFEQPLDTWRWWELPLQLTD